MNNSLANLIPDPSVDIVVVGDNETWTSIAQKAGRDRSLGALIQKANLQDSQQSELVAGQIIKVPQIVPVNKTAKTGLPLEVLMNMIEKPLMPYLKTPRPKHNLFTTIIEIIAVAVAVALTDGAVASTGSWLYTLADTLEMSHDIGAVATMTSLVMGALIEAGGETFGLVTGLQNRFNWDDVLNVAIAAATTTGLNLSAGKALNTLQIQITNAATLAIEQQFTLMAEGLQDHFDFKAVIESVETAGIDKELGAKTPMASSTLANEVANEVDDEAAGFAVNIFNGQSENFESSIIQSAASLVGEQAGDDLDGDLNHLYGQTKSPTEKSTYESPNDKIPSTKNLMQQEYNNEMQQAGLPTTNWNNKPKTTAENRSSYFNRKTSSTVAPKNRTPYKPPVPMTKEQRVNTIVNAIHSNGLTGKFTKGLDWLERQAIKSNPWDPTAGMDKSAYNFAAGAEHLALNVGSKLTSIFTPLAPVLQKYSPYSIMQDLELPYAHYSDEMQRIAGGITTGDIAIASSGDVFESIYNFGIIKSLDLAWQSPKLAWNYTSDFLKTGWSSISKNVAGFWSKSEEASNLKDLTGLRISKVRQVLQESGYEGKNIASSGYQRFVKTDGSQVDINWKTGRVVRTEAPKYDETGRRINKGQRVASNGIQIPRNLPHDLHPQEYFNTNSYRPWWLLAPAITIPGNEPVEDPNRYHYRP